MRCLKRTARGCEARRFVDRGVERGGVERTERGHAAENPVLAAHGAVAVVMRVEARRGLGQTREQRGFGGAEVGEGFAEKMFRRGGDAEAEVAVIEAVQVFGEDAVFAPDLLEPQGLRGLAEFGGERARTRTWFGDFDELLRDGGTARNDAAVTHEARGGARGREPIDAGMIPEAFVLRGERGGDEVRRNLREARGMRETAVVVRKLAQRAVVAIDEFEACGWWLLERGGEGNEVEREPQRGATGDECERDERAAAHDTRGAQAREKAAGIGCGGHVGIRKRSGSTFGVPISGETMPRAERRVSRGLRCD